MVKNPEQQKDRSEKSASKQTVSELVRKNGFVWKDVAPYLAESFKVCTKEQYNKALHDPKDPEMKQNIKYNIEIEKKFREHIAKWTEIPLPGSDAINKFSDSKREILKKFFYEWNTKNKWFEWYLNSLTTQQRASLDGMSDKNFLAFLRQQADKVQLIAATSSEWNMEQLSNIMQASRFEDEFNKFKTYPAFKDFQWKQMSEIDIWYTKLSPEARKKILEGNENDEEKAKKFLELTANMKLASESGLVQKLDAVQQAEFNKMMTEYYIYNESIGLGEQLKEIWWELYDKVKNMVVMYTETSPASPMDEMKNDIVKNENVKKYFTDNMQDELVSEAKKTDTYYQGLRKLYPELDKIIEHDPKIQELIHKKDLTEEEKKQLKQMLQEKTKSSGVENELLKETRSVVQEQAIITCLDMLTSYMNIDLNEQENVLEQFADVKHTINADEENKNVVLQINGKINGKNLKLYYNLTTWTLQQEEFLSRGAINAPFAINDPINGKQDIPSIQLPKFDDFIQGAKSLDYTSIIQNTENMQSYKDKVASELRQNVKKEWTRDIDTEKIMFEKNIMKNMATQEIFLFMEQNINESAKSFSSTDNEDIYAMYALMYNSLELYTLDELKTFRTNITALGQYKHEYMQYIQQKDTNKEKYILWCLGKNDVNHTENKKNEKKDWATESEYTYLKNYADFFAIFKDTTYTLSIIDPMIFDKFTYHIGLEVSKDQEYITRDDMKRNFNEFAERGDLPSLDDAFT